MAKFCKLCGAELREASAPPQKKKGKWWLIAIAAVLAVMVSGAVFWKPLLLKFAPDLYVAIVTGNTFRALEKRGGLGQVIQTAGDCMEDGTVDISATVSNRYIRNDYTIRAAIASEAKKKKWELNFQYNETKDDKNLDLGLYIDDDFLAVNSAQVNDGQYYGLTYDSFAEDLMHSGLSEKLTDEQIRLYDDMIQYYDDMISASNCCNHVLEPYAEIIREYTESIPVDVSTGSIELNGQETLCDTISYELNQDDLLDMMSSLVDKMEDDEDLRNMILGYSVTEEQKTEAEEKWSDLIHAFRAALNGDTLSFRVNKASGKMIFYAYKNRLVAMKMDVDFIDMLYEETSKAVMTLSFGFDPSQDDIRLEYRQAGAEEDRNILLVSGMRQEGSVYTHTLSIDTSINEKESNVKFQAVWDQQEGKVILTRNADDKKNSFEFGLKEIENGYEVSLTDLDTAYPVEIDLCVSFQKGTSIQTPKFVNLDQMNMEVFEDIYIDLNSSGLSIPIIGDKTSRFVCLSTGLWQGQADELESKARCLSYQYNKDVVLVYVFDSQIAPLDDYARKFYTENGYGYGDQNDGVIFVFNQYNRRCTFVPFGSCAETFTANEVVDIISACQRKASDGEDEYEVFSTCLEMVSTLYSQFYS